MAERNQLIDAVYKAVDELNTMRSPDKQVPKAMETVLSGPSAVLDSLGLVNLVVAIEDKLEDTFGVMVNLADQKAVASEHNPFRTLGTLTDYAGALLEQATGA